MNNSFTTIAILGGMNLPECKEGQRVLISALLSYLLIKNPLILTILKKSG